MRAKLADQSAEHPRSIVTAIDDLTAALMWVDGMSGKADASGLVPNDGCTDAGVQPEEMVRLRANQQSPVS
jgi:hypothetical protein